MPRKMSFRSVYTRIWGLNTAINMAMLMGVLPFGTLMKLKHNHVFHPTECVPNTALNTSVFQGMLLSGHGHWKYSATTLLTDATYFHLCQGVLPSSRGHWKHSATTPL